MLHYVLCLYTDKRDCNPLRKGCLHRLATRRYTRDAYNIDAMDYTKVTTDLLHTESYKRITCFVRLSTYWIVTTTFYTSIFHTGSVPGTLLVKCHGYYTCCISLF